MNELYEKCQSLVDKNLKGNVDKENLNILYASVLAIFLLKPELTLKKLPNILNSLNLIVGDKSVLNLAIDNIEGIDDTEILKSAGAVITRSINYDEETGNISLDNYLILSKDNKRVNKAEALMKITHELFHLLRQGSITKNNKEIKDIEGISIYTFNLETKVLKRKHMQVEEAIVQSYTNEALNLLKDYLNNNNINDFLKSLQKELSNFSYDAYDMHLNILNIYKRNPKIEELIDETFENFETQSKQTKYINSVMTSSSAFTKMSKNLDKLIENMNNGNVSNIENTKNIYLNMLKDAKEFLDRSQNKYKKL